MNGEVLDTLSHYIEEHILPQYASFDNAHQTDHAVVVIKESLSLASYYPVNLNMVYTIAAYHDVGLCEGREFHQLVSARMLMADRILRNWFTEEELITMAEAVEDHRASNRHEPRTIYGKIVAEADRFIDPITTLLRTIQYGLSHYPQLLREEQYTRFCEHLHEKYAEGGYLKLWIPESDNAIRLNELRRIIADKKKLSKIFDELFISEMTKRENNLRKTR